MELLSRLTAAEVVGNAATGEEVVDDKTELFSPFNIGGKGGGGGMES